MIAFHPKGPLLSFTGAVTAPTSVQAIGLTNEECQQYCVTNISTSIDCVLGWGQTDAEAKLNAAAGSGVSQCFYLPFGKQTVLTGPPNAYFTGITASSTAVIKVQAGKGVTSW